MSEASIRSKAFEWACDYEPWDKDLEYSKYAEEGYVQGYIQAKTDLERQLAESREKIDIHKGNLELAISLSDDSTVISLCTALLDQLKEKGE